MGKKTDAKIDTINKALEAWRVSLTKWAKTKDSLARASARSKELINKSQDYYDKHYVEGDQDREKKMAADKQWQQMENEVKQTLQAVSYLAKQSKEVTTETTKLKMAVKALLADFEKFIDDKDKNTKLGMNKKSVPAARAFIKEIKSAFA